MNGPAIRCATALLIAMSTAAIAAPPPNADPALHAWFEKQNNIDGFFCCSLADGHILSDDEWRSNKGIYEVRISGQWYPVSPGWVRDTAGGPNPTGHAIVWYGDDGYGVHLYCFAPGPEW
jgi:hypothetical protein